jgi:hypothetical protein
MIKRTLRALPGWPLKVSPTGRMRIASIRTRGIACLCKIGRRFERSFRSLSLCDFDEDFSCRHNWLVESQQGALMLSDFA